MLSTNVVVIHASGLIHSQLNYPLGARAEGQLSPRRPPSVAYASFDHQLEMAYIQAQLAQDLAGDTLLLSHQAQ